MHREGDEVHIDDVEASGGSKEGVMRWVLGVSLLLAVILMSLIWIIPALSQGDAEEEATATGRMEATMGDDGTETDSILGVEEADEIEGAVDSDDTAGVETTETETPE